ncbi:MAG: phospho-sugar mutase [Planctomycetota bacterium]|nr:MAG: phospho-sugar mutase [Planctomycetota bacterium]
MTPAELRARAHEWLRHDPDPATRSELEDLLARGDEAQAELAERFAGPLRFGTAGLRGLLGAGIARMNRAVVLRTTYGLAQTLLARDPERARRRGVAVGYDGRRMSREFAEDAVGVLAAQGVPAHLVPSPCPTPLLAFAVTELGAAAGVMITASHNPPEYNGYKVYAANGAQIVPPLDEAIAAAIDAAPPADAIERAEADAARGAGRLVEHGEELERRYLEAVSACATFGPGGRRDLPLVYTPLHGVGERLVRRILEGAGFSDLATVAEQRDPDGDFPTVRFPNPEEPGALDLGLALARERDAALLLANDPDADRLAVAVRRGPGDYVVLTGNELGVLLGHALLTRGAFPGGADRLVATTIVSSPQLGAIARSLGVRYEETLTGFKWIANLAIEQERAAGARFVFGYEEALGYTVGPTVRDKDGVGAALAVAELAAHLAAEGRTLLDALEDIAREYGLYASAQRSTVYPGTEGLRAMGAIMDGLRARPPATIAGARVIEVRDYLAGVGGLPRSNVLGFHLEGGDRIIARPSGTEPKIKFYFDVRLELGEEPYAAGKERARARIEELASAFAAIARPPA